MAGEYGKRRLVMFTGIIAAVGHIVARQNRGRDSRLEIAVGDLDLSDVAIGDSIAVNGVCLTAVAFTATGFEADVSAETLERTLFESLPVGTSVNLEKSLTPESRLGGHIVSGHVDGLAEVIAITPEGSTRPVATNQAKRRVITRVLPEPAPARINSGPSGACTAAA